MKSISRGFTTRILHSDRRKTIQYGSLHEPVHRSVAFAYQDARELAAVFQGRQQGFRYGRHSNPTVSALEEKITLMEEGVSSLCFASGMAAIGAIFQGLLCAGDHVVSSAFLFSNTSSLWGTTARQGVEVSFVDTTQVEHVVAALRPNTRLVFVETIANPCTQVADLEKIGQLCQERGILYVVDNTMTSPYLFHPKSVGAGLVVNSLTKAVAGHGEVLGGSLTDTGLFNWRHFPNILASYQKGEIQTWGMAQIHAKGLRDFGAALSADAAHQIAIGAETLALRVARASENATALARLLAHDARVARVHYPGMVTHAQHTLAAQLFRQPGWLVSFELREGIDCFDFLNCLELVILASNLGDTRTLAIPVAHTIFHDIGAERRASMGIAESLIRVSVGIEDTADLLADFSATLARF
ncbi:MAG: cystathionine gamma-synthase family protein [Ottowia sp.]|nr:cystathionine gamma-synthase family protein [Ottowia sp.]